VEEETMDIKGSRIPDIDVRKIKKEGKESPLQVIMRHIEGLVPGQHLTILVDHHPGHLYGVLERLGHSYATEELDGGMYWVTITSGNQVKEPVETADRSVTEETIINQVVNRFPETVETFHRFNIDACCGGSRTIAQAAKEDKTDLEALMWDLNHIIAQKQKKTK
jgi:uncharacterized protein (DUF2249 family)